MSDRNQKFSKTTTSGKLQLPAFALLCLLAIYFIACFHLVERNDGFRPWTTLGSWRMFTFASHYHQDMKAEALYGENWQTIDLKKLFPSRFASGYRYSRGSFFRNRTRLRTLARSTCLRLSSTPMQVRLTRLKWRKTPGVPASDTEHLQSNQLLNWSCNKKIKLPNGSIL